MPLPGERADYLLVVLADPASPNHKDAVDILGKTNDKIKTVDIAKMLDRSFIQSAQDRKLGG